VLLDWAREQGFDAVATGHYARREVWEGAGPVVLRGADRNKDQTYFLAMLQPHQVEAARFPVGHLLKPELRALAEAMGLKTAGKKDSQGICFIGEVRMEDFLRAFVPDRPGLIVDVAGKVLGEHKGLHLYTLGQRKGLRVPSNLYKQAYVVVAKRPERNELVIAIEREDTPLLWARRCTLTSLSSTGLPLTEERVVEAQPRYRCAAGRAVFRPFQRETGEWVAELEFEEAQRALTPGQICGLYEGDRLLGGAVFETVEALG
jgi:tRNA-specific 2-thiouridylase